MKNCLPTIGTLCENSGIWSPATIIITTLNITHGIASKHDVGKGTVVVNSVGDYKEENYETDFYIWNKNSKLQSEHKNIEIN